MTNVPAFHEFTAPAGVIDHLHALNDAGVHPERAGYDRNGNPFLVWFQEDGGDDVRPVFVYLGGEDAEVPVPTEWPLGEAYYPLYVIVPPAPVPPAAGAA